MRFIFGNREGVELFEGFWVGVESFLYFEIWKLTWVSKYLKSDLEEVLILVLIKVRGLSKEIKSRWRKMKNPWSWKSCLELKKVSLGSKSWSSKSLTDIMKICTLTNKKFDRDLLKMSPFILKIPPIIKKCHRDQWKASRLSKKKPNLDHYLQKLHLNKKSQTPLLLTTPPYLYSISKNSTFYPTLSKNHPKPSPFDRYHRNFYSISNIINLTLRVGVHPFLSIASKSL